MDLTVRLNMKALKALWFSAILILSGVALAATSTRIEIPGFSIKPLSDPGGEEWWIPSTKPLELSRYALTNQTITHPVVVTVLYYASSEQAKKAFEMSWGGRPAAPKAMKSSYWDAAHEWLKQPFQQVDMFLLKGSCVVGVSDLPMDFSAEKTDRLLHALADHIAKAGAPANRSQPVQPATNSTRVPAGSGR